MFTILNSVVRRCRYPTHLAEHMFYKSKFQQTMPELINTSLELHPIDMLCLILNILGSTIRSNTSMSRRYLVLYNTMA